MHSSSHVITDLWSTNSGKLTLVIGCMTVLLVLCGVCVAGGLLFSLAGETNPARPDPQVLAVEPTQTPVAAPSDVLPEAPLDPTSTQTRLLPTPTNTLVVLPSVPPTPLPTPTSTPVVPPTAAPPAAPVDPRFEEAFVIYVVDGDTIDVVIGRTEYQVRYILVDAPETRDPDTGVEPFGPEAAAFNESLVKGQNVILERDVSDTDQYGRLLRYVWLGDRLVNEELLRQGLAQVAESPPNVKYIDRFLVVQREAQAAGVGIWDR
jgi:endonuclease YncB( thermonuclease family)